MVVHLITTTPQPDAIFGPPSNAPWVDLYAYYWESIIPLSLFLFGATIGLVIFLQATSHLFGSFHRAKLIKRVFTGLLGLLSWWWVAGLSLRFVNALTTYLAPNLSDITLFETASFGVMGTLGLVVSLSVNLTLFLALGVVYLARQVVLYLFVLAMPILIVLWIPGVGPFALVSRFAKRLAGFYVPFLFMTLPVALLFRLGDILGNSFGLSVEGFGAWLLALIIPFVALLAPIIFVWQAGAIFFVADRSSRHVSRRTAGNRIEKIRGGGETAAHGSQNFARGVQGEPAQRRDGQYVFDSGDSRAHALGTRINRVVDDRRGGGGDGDSGGGGGSSASPTPNEHAEDSRGSDFEALRGRDRTTPTSNQARSADDDDDSTPRYIY